MTNIEIIQSKIYTVRGMKVMLDRDLAEMYQIKTEALNQAVKRNEERFPLDFMFQMTKDEFENWRSQFVMSNSDKIGLRRPHYVFTQEGVAMLSSVLKSKIAVEINIKIMRVFVEIRQIVTVQPEYELLRERIRRIELEARESKQERQIESRLIDGKLRQLSQSVQETNNKLDGLNSVMEFFSSVLDEFEKSHIIIKKPEEGLGTNSNN